MQLSDDSLMARVARGDRDALEVLYDRYAARVLGFSLQILGDRPAAEELLQESFWQVWQSAATFPSQHLSFTSWLFRIARNLSAAANSQQNLAHQGVKEMMDEDATLEPNLEGTKIRNALRSLPHEQRQVIKLAYFHGMTRQEIANSMGETLDTISGRARLGLRKLQETLERNDKIE